MSRMQQPGDKARSRPPPDDAGDQRLRISGDDASVGQRSGTAEGNDPSAVHGPTFVRVVGEAGGAGAAGGTEGTGDRDVAGTGTHPDPQGAGVPTR